MRIKDQPWFVSDTMRTDFKWTLDKLSSLSESPSLVSVGNRWKGFVDAGTWTVEDDAFWTYPHVFCEMAKVDPQLYARLEEADLVIFKGDLNYRKLVGDLNWETTVSFKTALQVSHGRFMTFVTLKNKMWISGIFTVECSFTQDLEGRCGDRTGARKSRRNRQERPELDDGGRLGSCSVGHKKLRQSKSKQRIKRRFRRNWKRRTIIYILFLINLNSKC